MNVFPKEHFAYLVKQHLEVQFQWVDLGPQEVTLTFFTRGLLRDVEVMPTAEARQFWDIMIKRRGYTKGVKCSTHLIK